MNMGLDAILGTAPERPRRLGTSMFVQHHNMRGHFFPVDILDKYVEAAITQEPLILVDRDGNTYDEAGLRELGHVIKGLVDITQYSPGVDYCSGFIGGDIGEVRKVVIDGDVKEVLVIPQGGLRAEKNAANFAELQMVHPLAGDSKGMLSVMAQLLYSSTLGEDGFTAPYLRLRGVANAGNDMAITHPELQSSLIGVTWQFFAEPSYRLPQKDKWLMVADRTIEGHPLSQYKISRTYQTRIFDKQRLLNSKAAAQLPCDRPQKDVAYLLRNGMLGDATCQNVAFVVDKGDSVKLVFVEGSDDNYFFVGKTQQTVKEVIEKLQPAGVEMETVYNPQEFSDAVGYTKWYPGSGAERAQAALENVAGMIVLGTFKGIERVGGLLTYRDRHPGQLVEFPWPEHVSQKVQDVQDLLWQTVYGINGGTALTADPRYCTMFSTDKLALGIAEPLDLTGKRIADYSG